MNTMLQLQTGSHSVLATGPHILFMSVSTSVVRTIHSELLLPLADECSEWHIVVAWIATKLAESTQSTTRQPTVIVTTNIGTFQQSRPIKTASQCTVDQRLVWRTRWAYNAHSGGIAKARKLTVLHRALWQEIMTLNEQISDSNRQSPPVVWAYHVIQHNLCCQYCITATVCSYLHLNQLQVLLQKHVCTTFLARKQKVNTEWLQGSCDKRNSLHTGQRLSGIVIAAGQWKKVIHKECQHNRRWQAHRRWPHQWQVNANEVVWLNGIAGHAAKIRLTDNDDRALENVGKNKDVKLLEEVIWQLITGDWWLVLQVSRVDEQVPLFVPLLHIPTPLQLHHINHEWVTLQVSQYILTAQLSNNNIWSHEGPSGGTGTDSSGRHQISGILPYKLTSASARRISRHTPSLSPGVLSTGR